MKKRIAAAILAATMAVSLTACGGSDKADSDKGEKASQKKQK